MYRFRQQVIVIFQAIRKNLEFGAGRKFIAGNNQ